ncbi:hypothetical protein BHM03_00028803 [Ensete ventricosum]|nr:hypothetical protein BHM03_00028803 [Ensete ventricosum]
MTLPLYSLGRPTNEFPHPFARVPQSAAYRVSLPLADWGSLVDVVGFCFLNLGTKYQPKQEFVQWIQQGPKPIYIGFGSMLRKASASVLQAVLVDNLLEAKHIPWWTMYPLDDAEKLTTIILEALKETGQRGIISHGWGNLGSFLYTTDAVSEVPVDVYLLGDCPHDWLFPQCSAVVSFQIHGSSWWGWDNSFWIKSWDDIPSFPSFWPTVCLFLFFFYLFMEVKLRAMELREQIDNEDGVAAAVDAFHRHLPPQLPIPPPPPPPDDGPTNPIQWLPQFVFHALHGPPFTHRLIVLAILYYILIVIFLCVNMGY